MSIRTILVPLAGSNDIGPVVELGLTMGTDLGAHVEVLHILSDPKDTIPLLGEGMSVSMIEDMIDAAEKEGGDRAARGQQVFDDLCRQFSVTVGGKPGEAGASASWGQEVGRDDEVTARRGRLADLIVVGRPTETSDVSSTLTLNAALFDTGRPVLVAPPGGTGNFGKHIAISWNGGAQAARAVGSALGMIKRAEKVTVLTAESDRTTAARAPELAAYLEWHGIAPDTRTFSVEGRQPGGADLLAECSRTGADLLVMGAYTHSRMRQLILGGVTRHVLEEAEIPLFMAH
jgi:nucleotide-binding universal stress UspA family protein